MRVVRCADGYYCQFCIDHERVERREPTGKTIIFWRERSSDRLWNVGYLVVTEVKLRQIG
ncbi:hypothetical protein LC605_06050 [Nostoc sp. CHAB 5836]|nr:hypothetical protein [Nostoc sp. CHAB 5836]